MTARILFHPRLLASRAAEIAQSQKKGSTAGLRNPARLWRDAYGRPFVRAADPLAEAPAAPPEPERFAWLIRVIRALGREAGPPMGRPLTQPGGRPVARPTR